MFTIVKWKVILSVSPDFSKYLGCSLCHRKSLEVSLQSRIVNLLIKNFVQTTSKNSFQYVLILRESISRLEMMSRTYRYAKERQQKLKKLKIPSKNFLELGLAQDLVNTAQVSRFFNVAMHFILRSRQFISQKQKVVQARAQNSLALEV